MSRAIRRARYLLLGSAAPGFVHGVSESLAGRVTLVELPGLDLADVGGERLDGLWLRGGLPPAFTAATLRPSTSMPTVVKPALANSTARGNPTYPRPMTATWAVRASILLSRSCL